MTPELREKIRFKANELRDIYVEAVRKQSGNDFVWNNVASHCLEQEIKGKIDLLREFNTTLVIHTKINELNSQLKEIRGE